MYWPNIAVKYAFWLWCFAAPTAGCVLACVVSDYAITENSSCNSVPRVLACWHSLRQANMGCEKYSLHLIFTFYLNRERSVLELFAVVVFKKKKILRVDSSRRARDTAAIAHTVNCVICNNHTKIDWMLLNLTPVIQQNCHHPGRKFEKSFCAVDRLSCCQLELSKSKTSQFRSDLVFEIVNYMHVIFLHGG